MHCITHLPRTAGIVEPFPEKPLFHYVIADGTEVKGTCRNQSKDTH